MTGTSAAAPLRAAAAPIVALAVLLGGPVPLASCRRARAPGPTAEQEGADARPPPREEPGDGEILSKVGPPPDVPGIVSGPHLMPLAPVEDADGGHADRIRDKAVPEPVSAAAESQRGGPCAQSYAALEVLAQAAQKSPPARRDYLRLCAQLPEAMQRCMVPDHQVAHADECTQVAAESDPGVRQELEELLSGGASSRGE